MRATAALLCAAPSALGAAPSVTLNNGVKMPQVALGTWQYSSSKAGDAVQKAFAAGFTAIDTAKQYGNDKGIGEALKASKKSRDSYFVITKTPGCYESDCYKQTTSDVEGELNDLGLDYVDLVLLHWPSVCSSSSACSHSGGCTSSICAKNAEQWRAYEDLYKQGKAKAIGVSNYCASCLDCLLSNATVKPAVNQIQWYVGMGTDPAGLVSHTTGKGILPQAYSPLNRGQLASDSTLSSIGKSYQKSAAQVALKWLVDKGAALATKADSTEYLEQDIDLFSWTLSAKDTTAVDNKKGRGAPSFSCSK